MMQTVPLIDLSDDEEDLLSAACQKRRRKDLDEQLARHLQYKDGTQASRLEANRQQFFEKSTQHNK